MVNFSSVNSGGSARVAQPEVEMTNPKTWNLDASELTHFRPNPIREIVDNIAKRPRDMDKSLISLSIGDPTAFGNLKTPEVLVNAIVRSALSTNHNGYLPTVGSEAAREAIAQAHSPEGFPVTKDDVILTHGGLGAISMAISGLASAGDNILIPRPGFSAYEVACDSLGIEFRFYDLLPEKKWEADLTHLESLIDTRTKAILVNNPSNPCGSVYTKSHLEAILNVADANKVPIITDEIYGDMVFGESKFYSMASLSANVPIVELGGLAKHFLVPGWRVGWLIVHDRLSALERVRKGFLRLSQLTFCPNSLAQSIVPDLLTPASGSVEEQTLKEFKKSYYSTLEHNAEFTIQAFQNVPGLEVVQPQGAMYAMIKIDPSVLRDIKNDIDFATKLVEEESVVVLPGQCFGISNYLRIVLAPPQPVLGEAFARIEAFCRRHSNP